jgi:hypothetical protein
MHSKPGPARSGRPDRACMSHSTSTRTEEHTDKRLIRARVRMLRARYACRRVERIRAGRTRHTRRVACSRLHKARSTLEAFEVDQAIPHSTHAGLVVRGGNLVLQMTELLHHLSALASLPDAARQTAHFLVLAEQAEAREAHAVSAESRAGIVRELVFWTADHVRQRDASLRAVEVAGTELAQVRKRGPEHAGDTHGVAQVRCPSEERAEILVVLRHGTPRLVLADMVQRTRGAGTESVPEVSVHTPTRAPTRAACRGLLVRTAGCARVVVTPVVRRTRRTAHG